MNQKDKNVLNANIYEKNQAITLIALVVTIIVLLILAGVSIAVLAGENGILNRAKDAVNVHKIGEEDEQKKLSQYENILLEYENNLGDKLKIKTISNRIKGISKDELIGYEEFVGDYIKIGDEALSAVGLKYTGEYYVNTKTGDVYDIAGEEKNGITYHNIQQYYQITKSNDITKTNKIMQIIQSNIQNIKELQYQTGAVATYSKSSSKSSKSVPYFNCMGISALIDDIPSLPNAKNYIQWHFNHINSIDVDGIVGTIYDYNIMPDGTESFNEERLYDSIDSYCTLFFMLLEKYYNKTGDDAIIKNNTDKLEKIEIALNNMFNYNNSGTNLTLTKEQYKVYYLMDNCESYGGYNALANIYEKIYNNTEKATTYRERANLIKTAIEEKLWDEKSSPEFSNYDYAYQNTSYQGLFFDRTYYPYVLCQIYPVLYDIVEVDSEKSKHLYFLNQYYSNSGEQDKGMWYTFKNSNTDYPHFEVLYTALKYKTKVFDTRVHNYQIDVGYEIEQAISNIIYDFNLSTSQFAWTIGERGYLIKSLNEYLSN